VTFPRPESGTGAQPLFAVADFTTSTRGDLDITGDWGVASNAFVLSIRRGNCANAHPDECTILASGTTGIKPARVALAGAPAGTYSLVVLIAPTSGTLAPDTVSYRVFLAG
jgi:hypothetical protein